MFGVVYQARFCADVTARSLAMMAHVSACLPRASVGVGLWPARPGEQACGPDPGTDRSRIALDTQP